MINHNTVRPTTTHQLTISMAGILPTHLKDKVMAHHPLSQATAHHLQVMAHQHQAHMAKQNNIINSIPQRKEAMMISEAIRLIHHNSNKVAMVLLLRRDLVRQVRQDQMVQKANVDLVRRFWELLVADYLGIRLATEDSVLSEVLLLPI